MRVIHIVNDVLASSGGVPRAVIGYALEVKPFDVASTVITVRDDRGPTVQLGGVDVLQANSAMRAVALLHQAVSQAEGDCVVHVHGIWYPLSVLASIYAAVRGIPLVTSLHGSVHPIAFAHKRLKKLLAWRAYQKRVVGLSDIIHVTTEQESRYAGDVGVRVERIVVPIGVRRKTDRLDVDNAKVENRVVFIGRLHPIKGVEQLIDAWLQISPSYPNAKLEIVGDGDREYVGQLKRKVQLSAACDSVEFSGVKYGEDKWSAIKKASALVLPSKSENFGIVVIESLSVGTPVLSTFGTPWKDLLDYSCGWLARSETEDLKAALDEVMSSDVEHLKKMGENGRRLVLEKYSWDKVGAKMAGVYLDRVKSG